MKYIDQAALDLLKANINPKTNRVDMTINELAARLYVCRNTATNITERLQNAKQIVKHRTRGRGGAEIEVCREADNVNS